MNVIPRSPQTCELSRPQFLSPCARKSVNFFWNNTSFIHSIELIFFVQNGSEDVIFIASMHFVNSYHTQKQKVHFEFLVEFKEFAGNQLNVICVFCVTIAIEGHGVAILASLIWKAALHPYKNRFMNFYRSER